MSPEDAVTMFKWFQKETKAGDVAAALLVLATTTLKIQSAPDDHLAHEICMGIRKGLFGADAEANRSINQVAEIIADAIPCG